MNPIFFYAAGRSWNDHPLTKAARVALEADQTPRPIQMAVDHDGTPIEIPQREPLSQTSEE